MAETITISEIIPILLEHYLSLPVPEAQNEQYRTVTLLLMFSKGIGAPEEISQSSIRDCMQGRMKVEEWFHQIISMWIANIDQPVTISHLDRILNQILSKQGGPNLWTVQKMLRDLCGNYKDTRIVNERLAVLAPPQHPLPPRFVNQFERREDSGTIQSNFATPQNVDYASSEDQNSVQKKVDESSKSPSVGGSWGAMNVSNCHTPWANE